MKCLGSEKPTDADPIITFSFNMLRLSLRFLFCFVNVKGVLISIYLINKYNVEERSHKYKKIFRVKWKFLCYNRNSFKSIMFNNYNIIKLWYICTVKFVNNHNKHFKL